MKRSDGISDEVTRVVHVRSVAVSWSPHQLWRPTMVHALRLFHFNTNEQFARPSNSSAAKSCISFSTALTSAMEDGWVLTSRANRYYHTTYFITHVGNTLRKNTNGCWHLVSPMGCFCNRSTPCTLVLRALPSLFIRRNPSHDSGDVLSQRPDISLHDWHCGVRSQQLT